jgi:alpha-glucuronidase
MTAELRKIVFATWVRHVRAALLILICGLNFATPCRSETHEAAWLQYSPIVNKELRERYAHLPAVVVRLDDSTEAYTAGDELVRGVREMLGRTPRIQRKLTKESAIVMGTFAAVKSALPSVSSLPDLAEDGFWLKTIELDGRSHLLVAAPNDRGLLYGVMHLLRKIALHEPISSLNEKQSPFWALRVLSHSDHFDGSVERGYAGRSLFWEGGRARKDVKRITAYGRLLASVGIGGCVVNAAPAEPQALTPEQIRETAKIADVLRPWGVRVFLSVDIASPQLLGATRTADPLDPNVAAFWQRAANDVYRAIPNLGGFAVSPVSDGRVAAREYHRTHADAANTIAAALARHGGVLLYETNLHALATRREPDNDLARLSYDEFQSLDGEFAENVVLLASYGPSDFQVREAPSPMFAGLARTRQAMAVSLAQELTGQQRHLCYLAPAWKGALEFKMPTDLASMPVKQIVGGSGRIRGGMIAEAGVGRDRYWLGHPLSMANLYAFGRLAWNPDLATKDIAEEWSRLTFGHDPSVVGGVVEMLMKSRRVYESYTGPLGIGAPTDRQGSPYGPDIFRTADSRSDWRFTDATGIGHDRTQATGSGFIGQYPPSLASMYESLETCPDDLLLFMHHVPYTHVLKSGKTVIQQMYDAHYQGARDAARAVDKWRRLEGLIDDTRYHDVLTRLDYQAGHAQVWRDAVCNWLAKTSGVEDGENRVGNHGKRVEAEAMRLEGFEVREANPWESASGGEYVECAALDQPASARWKYKGKAAWVDISIWYFDECDGASQFQLFVGDQLIDAWTADLMLGDDVPNGNTATRHRVARVALRTGDELTITATADGDE